VDGIFLPAGKVEAEAISQWKLLTMVALTVMNASWASAFLRTIAYPGAQRNTLILIIFFTLLPLATVFILTAVQALKLTASAERTAGLAVLVIAVLAAFGTHFCTLTVIWVWECPSPAFWLHSRTSISRCTLNQWLLS
jgi:hypothetical protein